MTEGPYCRVYWTVMSDEKFDGIRENPTHLGSWLTLLLVADMAWPAPAFLPPSVPKRIVDLLEHHELIEKLPGWRFKVRGLDAERAGRSDKARDAAAVRWASKDKSGSNAPSIARGIAQPVLAEQSRAETEHSTRAREGLRSVSDPVVKAWQRATGRPFLTAGAFALDYLDSVCERHPEPDVLAAIGWAREQFRTAPTSQQLAVMVRSRLDPLPDVKATAKANAEQREQEAGRRRVQATKARIHDQGAHADEPDPMCDRCRGAA